MAHLSYPPLTPVQDIFALPLSIEPTLSYSLLSSDVTDHISYMDKVIKKCISASLLPLPLSLFKPRLLKELPKLVWDEPETIPGCLDLYFLTLAAKEDSTETRLVEILKSWTVPGKISSLLSTHTLHFRWDLFPHEAFLAIQGKLLVKNSRDLSKALLHLPSLSIHLASSLKNASSFKNFFSHRPLLEDTKSATVHRELVFLIEKFPSLFDSSLFIEMGRFFSLCPKPFFTPRSSRLITKIISLHSFMRTHLLRQFSLYPERRHLALRFTRTELHFCFGSKPVLGLVLAIAPLDKHELFEESHILEAAQSLLPDVQHVQSSFYRYQGTQDPLCTLYIELEKKDGSRFSSSEMLLLKKELEHELKRRIEKLIPSVFMIRNEEETMRNILILSQELKYLSDLPQVMISLEKQTASEVFFTVILVRLVKQGQNSLTQSFYPLQTEVKFIQDRLQHVGFLRKNYPKEANVFHLVLSKDSSLLRPDYSVNFYLARQKITSLLTEAIGPFRDYNGGMILKQGELFYQFKESFSLLAQKNSELLENFFFSLNPIETQATLPLSSLQILFLQFLEAKEAQLFKREHSFLKIEEKKEQLFITIRTQDISFKEELHAVLLQYELLSKNLIHTFLQWQGAFYTGILFTNPDTKKHSLLIEAVHKAIDHWKSHLNNLQILKLSFSHFPTSLDPRIDGDETSSTLAKMLFEGLCRLTQKGEPELALAQSVELSKDGTHYLFKLKKSYWSDGTQVTAYDFESSWKKVLSPHFSTPFSYLFYPIKNAHLAKEGLCSLEHVGIKALHHNLLAVDLEHPTPEFLELTALSIYSPVPHIIDKIHPDWGGRGSADFVCNGPFLLKKAILNVSYELGKNPLYWDEENVRLQNITLSKNLSVVAHSMFKQEEIDWLGSPMHPWEPSFDTHPEEKIPSVFAGLHWSLFNTEKFPFHNVNLRKAFHLAINRKDLTNKMAHSCLPASTPLPLSHTMHYDPNHMLGDEKKALEYFELALQELGISRRQFPLFTLIFADHPLREKTARYLVERWKSLFHIPCRAEKFEYPIFCSKVLKGDFQLTHLYWKSWIDHPLYTLAIFKYKTDTANLCHWTHPDYQTLVSQAEQEIDPIKRLSFLSQAEALLLDELPVIPLYYEKEQMIRKNHLQQIIYSKTTGYLDFKYAYINRTLPSTDKLVTESQSV